MLAAEVGAKVDLLTVELRSASAELTPPQHGEQIDMTVSWETSFERLPESQIEYRYRVAVVDGKTESFYVRAEFALRYEIGGSLAFSDEQLQAFGEVSVAFSAFPYRAELIQSLTVRASLPPLVLGTLRAPIDPPRTKTAKRPAKKAAPRKVVAPKQQAARATSATRAAAPAKVARRTVKG